jgi:SNW domain-containing protein 1
VQGYTIPLHQRLAADGRGLQEVQINDKFAKLSVSGHTRSQREAVGGKQRNSRKLMLYLCLSLFPLL